MPRKIPKPVQQFRGTTAQHATYTGPEGEITVDTTKHTAVVHDGETAGGFPLMREHDIVDDVQIAASVGAAEAIWNVSVAVAAGDGDWTAPLALSIQGKVNTPIARVVNAQPGADHLGGVRVVYKGETQQAQTGFSQTGGTANFSFTDGTTCAVVAAAESGGKQAITFTFTFAATASGPFLCVSGVRKNVAYEVADPLLSQDPMNALTAGTDGKIMLDGSGLDKSYLPLYFPFESDEIVPEIHTFFPDHCRVILVDGLQSDGTSVDALGITVQLDGDSEGTSAVTLKNGQIDSDGAFAGKAVVIRCSGRTTETWVSALLRLTPTMLASDL